MKDGSDPLDSTMEEELSSRLFSFLILRVERSPAVNEVVMDCISSLGPSNAGILCHYISQQSVEASVEKRIGYQKIMVSGALL